MSMWNKRASDDDHPRAEQRRPASPAEVMQAPPPPPARSAADTQRRPAAIGQSMVVKGEILSREDLSIDGEMEGKLDVGQNRLTIGPNAKIRASIRAREVEIYGAVHGNVEASDRIILRKNSRLTGDLKMASVVIEDGAFFKGSIDITQPQTAKTAAAPASGQPSSVSASTSG
jgi:cytoskeletal protein CcmA (bactofilin family)